MMTAVYIAGLNCTDMDATFWDSRYKSERYVYGEMPNKFLAAQLAHLQPGKILFPADGEGRNSVYAATLGWESFAFDQSTEGKRKADQLALKNGVVIRYDVATVASTSYAPAEFDVVALIFAHFGGAGKMADLQTLAGYVKPGGRVIFEAYSKDHIKFNSVDPKVGGPSDVQVLYSLAELTEAFAGYQVLQLEQVETEIWEGDFHGGLSSVVRFLGRKPY